ncbi:hypothetical protein [Nocardioides sp. Leaf374]|nr:hypothetical protein [Nocardioides sp. Leaf374]
MSPREYGLALASTWAPPTPEQIEAAARIVASTPASDDCQAA